MKAVLEVIGAVVVTIVILGIPVLSFMSFIYDWPSFMAMTLLLGSAIDSLYILEKLIGETE